MLRCRHPLVRGFLACALLALPVSACNGPSAERAAEGTGDDAGLSTASPAAGESSAAAPSSIAPAPDAGRLAEVCGNGVDDDQNGAADEGCVCKGTAQRCFLGQPALAGVGACAWGEQLCGASGEFKLWSACVGSGTPRAEQCGNAIDDDCDGSIDEGCECAPGETRSCFGAADTSAERGTCKRGTQTCQTNGTWGACDGQVLPQASDACNGVDEDCDGVVDNGCECLPGATTSCYAGPANTAGVGLCVAGARACVLTATGSTWGACEGAIVPASETCNAKDDDCDGVIDEGCECLPGATRDCYGGPDGTAGKGACRSGSQTCNASGKWDACSGDVVPTLEICGNAKDDDCSGTIDNGCECLPGTKASCYSGPPGTAGVGFCKAGTKTCAALAAGGSAWSACAGEVGPGVEACNATDDDCDGQVDETCECLPGATRGCYGGPVGTGGVGRCVLGNQTCGADGKWLACTGDVLPTVETCGNGIDDDCSGAVDNGCVCTPGATAACYTGTPGTADVGACKSGTKTCVALAAGGSIWGPCAGDVLPTSEVCNAKDDDCDGQLDETCECVPGTTRSCYGGPDGTANVGACKSGTQSCTANGTWAACSGDVVPRPEICGNAIDDDCSAGLDNGCACAPGATEPCYTGSPATRDVGLCKSGTRTCSALPSGGSSWGSCSGQVLPQPEVVDGKDNDCDGITDYATIAADDFDSTSDGRVVVVGRKYNVLANGSWESIVRAQCHDATGQALAPVEVFREVSSSPTISEPVEVSRSKVVASAAILVRTGEIGNRRTRVFFLDAACSLLPTQYDYFGEHEERDITIDDAGRSTVISRTTLQRDFAVRNYSPTGALRFELLLPAMSQCGNGLHVAVRATTGSGVVTCQSQSWEPVSFRRFTVNGAWTDASFVAVPPTTSAGSWFDSHDVGMNDDGSFVITWFSGMSPTTHQHASFFSSTATYLGTSLVRTSASQSYDQFRRVHVRIPHVGSDFLVPVRIDSRTVAIARYTAAGVKVGETSVGGSAANVDIDDVGGRYAVTVSNGFVRNAFSIP